MVCRLIFKRGRGARYFTATAIRKRWWEQRRLWPLLQWANFEVTEVDSGCCGMAGSFGFDRSITTFP